MRRPAPAPHPGPTRPADPDLQRRPPARARPVIVELPVDVAQVVLDRLRRSRTGSGRSPGCSGRRRRGQRSVARSGSARPARSSASRAVGARPPAASSVRARASRTVAPPVRARSAARWSGSRLAARWLSRRSAAPRSTSARTVSSRGGAWSRARPRAPEARDPRGSALAQSADPQRPDAVVEHIRVVRHAQRLVARSRASSRRSSSASEASAAMVCHGGEPSTLTSSPSAAPSASASRNASAGLPWARRSSARAPTQKRVFEVSVPIDLTDGVNPFLGLLQLAAFDQA